ncbi:hypothetical protein [Halorarius litoreus]|uniref:hypothetical protein n=1 Tax=Halorarius litoreus TaxID=2962676 RepID=UPI0020CFC130|nr:hypothetical protein [Halorarius litoreus]
MSQAEARQRALDAVGAFEDDDVVGLGERKAIDRNGATYVPVPNPQARNRGVVPGVSVEVYIHAPTGAFIVLPAEQD